MAASSNLCSAAHLCPCRWLSDQFTAKGSAFMQASVSFLDGKLRSEQPALQVRWRSGPGVQARCLLCVHGAVGSDCCCRQLPLYCTVSQQRSASRSTAPLPALQTAATSLALPGAGSPAAGRINLSEATLEVFLRVLAANAGLLPSDTLQQFKQVQAAAVQAHPQLAAVVGDSSSLEAFAPDIGAWVPGQCTAGEG